MFSAKSSQPQKLHQSHATDRHVPTKAKLRASRPRKRATTNVRSEAQLADLRDLFEHIQRRDRRVAAAMVTIAEHLANTPGNGLARALGIVVAFVAREAR
jgi:hypothetical protein